LFVFAFGLSLFVAHADDSVKRLGKYLNKTREAPLSMPAWH